MKILIYVSIGIAIGGAILYLFWSIKRARRSDQENPFDSLPANDEYDPDQLQNIQTWNAENRPLSGREMLDESLVMVPEVIEAAPPVPAHLEKMFDEQFTQPRKAKRDEGLIRLLTAINQTPLEDAIEFIEILIETIEAEAEFDKPAPEGKTPRDGHSAAWHGYFALVNARSYLKNEPILYIADVGGVYSPVFTREGENYMSTWEHTRRRWLSHSSDDQNPSFAEIHQDFDRRAVPCDHPFEWLCPGECGARLHVAGRYMPEHLENGGLCTDCHICEKMKSNNF